MLKNLTIKFVGGLLPHKVGVFFINAIVICNTFNLLCNFVLKVRHTSKLAGPLEISYLEWLRS